MPTDAGEFGGYDYEFVETPPKAWECPVCLLTLRDPHLLSCCGATLCHSCVSRIEHDPCPICRAVSFTNSLDKNLQHSILDMKVKCLLGCTWTGELRYIEIHMSPLNDGDCPLATVTCKYGCGQVMKRVDMTNHEDNTCPKLPIEVKLAKIQVNMERQIMEIKNNYETEILILKVELTEQREEMTKQRRQITEQEQQIQQMKIELEKVKDENDLLTTAMSDVLLHQVTAVSHNQPRRPHGLEATRSTDVSSGTMYSNFSSDVLLLMSKLKIVPGVIYYPEQGSVEFVMTDPEEREQMISSFKEAYQRIVQSSLYKLGTLELPSTAISASVVRLVNQYNDRYHQCHLSYDASTHSVKVVALSSHQYDQAMKILKQELNVGQTRYVTQNVVNPKRLKCCDLVFCTACIDRALDYSESCPVCYVPQQSLNGNQPKGSMTFKIIPHHSLPGFPNCGTIKITYHFPHGTQGDHHPSPGKPYTGTTHEDYLPDNDEGRHVLKLLQRAFNAGLVFTIGSSKTTGGDDTVIRNDIHHRASTRVGSAAYGYPDETYLKKVKEDLKAKGIY